MSKRNELAQRIGPGLWKDKDGNAHFSIPELLVEFGLEDTPENHVACREMIEGVLKEQWPEAKVFHRATDGDTLKEHDAN